MGKRWLMQRSIIKNYNDLPDILNSSLVAQTLGVGYSTANKIMKSDGFPSFNLKKNGHRFVTRVDFIAWIDEQAYLAE